MQVDHFLPQNRLICKPPTATFDQIHCEKNYMPACRACNKFKSTFSLETFRSEIQKQVERLRRDKPTFRLAERYGLIECNSKPVVFYFEALSDDIK